MILNFYVQGKPPGSSSILNKDISESYLDAMAHWAGEKASRLSKLTLNETVEWTKDSAFNAWERSKRAFRYLSGAPLPPMSLPEHPQVNVKEFKKAESKGWSFVGIFSGLRGSHAGSTNTNIKQADEQMWTDGEVHADLIRVRFVFQPLDILIDMDMIER